jgi:hypothetical protein
MSSPNYTSVHSVSIGNSEEIAEGVQVCVVNAETKNDGPEEVVDL